jgi:sec-independent protein translocase protein TatA
MDVPCHGPTARLHASRQFSLPFVLPDIRRAVVPSLGDPVMFGLGTTELVVFALIVLVLFGSRLPKVMRSLGSSITEFKKGVHEGNREDEEGPAEQRVESKSN